MMNWILCVVGLFSQRIVRICSQCCQLCNDLWTMYKNKKRIMFMMHGESSRAFFSVVGKPALHRRVRFNRVYVTIFRAKVWKKLLFEWILLLKIQTN